MGRTAGALDMALQKALKAGCYRLEKSGWKAEGRGGKGLLPYDISLFRKNA